MSIQTRVETAVFTEKLKEYKRLTGKAMSDVVREQSRLLAVRLVQLTPPYSASQGKKRVEIDISKVYLKSSWFTEKFTFRNQKLNERVRNAVYAKDEETLRDIFQNSSQLRRIHLEPFDAGKHAQLRRNGRVGVPMPFSFPLQQEGALKSYVAQKKKRVGIAKGAWAAAAQALGKSQPGWLDHRNAGGIEDNSKDASPSITLINRVSYFPALDAKANIVSRAMAGRERDMTRSAEAQLRRASKQANLD